MTSIISKLPRLFIRTVKDLNFINQSRQESTKSSKLLYSVFGEPVNVLQKVDNCLIKDLNSNEVLIKMIASPVNPADINTIQGKYPVKIQLPSVPGNEGVGDVIQTGNQVTNVVAGDRVIIIASGLGTWRQHLVVPSRAVHKVPKSLGIAEAATLTVNPCTAYRLLRDFVPLKPGDTVIQNGGNSSVGQSVIQIARVWGFKTVNIVRNRSDINELKSYMQSLGATYVLTEEELRVTDLFKTKILARPKLALNGVGGKSSMELVRHLDQGATLVTYGGMSREPVLIPTGALIFKDLRLRGFWMTDWSNKHYDSPDREEMFDELITMMMTKRELQGSAYTLIPFSDYREALTNTMNIKGKTGQKYILDFTK